MEKENAMHPSAKKAMEILIERLKSTGVPVTYNEHELEVKSKWTATFVSSGHRSKTIEKPSINPDTNKPHGTTGTKGQ